MPYTRTSLAVLWVVVLVLFLAAGSGAVTGPWRLLLVAVALAAPALVLRDPVLAKAPAPEHKPSLR